MMKQPVVGSYRDVDGARHELVVRQTADGDWQVLDTGPDRGQGDRHAGRRPGRPPAGRGDRPRLPDHRRRSRVRGGTGGRRAHT